MKRTGRILICLACGLAFGALVRADNAGTPPGLHSPPGLNKALLEKLRKKHPGIKMAMPGGMQPTASEPSATPANAATATEATVNTPYDSIVTRNVFGLNPIPPPDVQQPDTAPPPKITVTGITTILGPTEALFKVSGVIRDGKPPQDESYILTAGERQDDVEVTAIDVEKGTVTFNNHGVVQQIPLVVGVASGGPAASSGPGPGGSGGPGGFEPGRFGRPNFNNLPPNIRQRFQQRFGGGNGNGFNGNGNGAQYSPQQFNGGYNNNNYNQPNQQQSAASQLSPEDNSALIAAQKAQLEQQGNPEASIFPPTQFDEDARKEAGGPPVP